MATARITLTEIKLSKLVSAQDLGTLEKECNRKEYLFTQLFFKAE